MEISAVDRVADEVRHRGREPALLAKAEPEIPVREDREARVEPVRQLGGPRRERGRQMASRRDSSLRVVARPRRESASRSRRRGAKPRLSRSLPRRRGRRRRRQRRVAGGACPVPRRRRHRGRRPIPRSPRRCLDSSLRRRSRCPRFESAALSDRRVRSASPRCRQSIHHPRRSLPAALPPARGRSQASVRATCVGSGSGAQR